jgi:membrane protease YdiL (CAAX protease family)
VAAAKAKPGKAAKAAKAGPARSAKPTKATGPAKAAKPARKAGPAKAATAKEPKAATAKEPKAAPAAKPAPTTPTTPAAPTAQGWIPIAAPVPPAPPVPPVPRAASSSAAPSRPRPAFDPVTGAWLSAEPAAPPADAAPEASIPKGSVRYVLWTILLWIDLAALAFATVAAIVTGLILIFAPDSASADRLRDQLQGGTVADIVLNTVLGLVAFGLIPFLWVWGTRREPKEGTKRFLRLHLQRDGKGQPSVAATVLWGFALALGMLLVVAVLITAYTCATQPDCLAQPAEDENPAVQGLLDNLSWPLAFLIALGAGVGEEVFFRGFLQRYVGVWGQAVLFGLAHATGGYLPQILFALGLGIAFGFLVKRGWSLWTLILAHFLYDFTLLGLALLYPELG